jgi:plasmid stabilization system protein ParE
MIYQIIVEPEALQDLLNIKTYITEQDTINKANQFISELKNNIKTLNEMPQRCRKSLYTDDENTHDFIYKKYTTVFKIIENRVHILTIFRQNSYSL